MAYRSSNGYLSKSRPMIGRSARPTWVVSPILLPAFWPAAVSFLPRSLSNTFSPFLSPVGKLAIHYPWPPIVAVCDQHGLALQHSPHSRHTTLLRSNMRAMSITKSKTQRSPQVSKCSNLLFLARSISSGSSARLPLIAKSRSWRLSCRVGPLRRQIQHMLELCAPGLRVLIVNFDKGPIARKHQQCLTVEAPAETCQICLSVMQVAKGQVLCNTPNVFEMRATRRDLCLSYTETAHASRRHGVVGSGAVCGCGSNLGGASPGGRREHTTANAGHRYVRDSCPCSPGRLSSIFW